MFFFGSARQNNNEKKITVNLIIINPILVGKNNDAR